MLYGFGNNTILREIEAGNNPSLKIFCAELIPIVNITTSEIKIPWGLFTEIHRREMMLYLTTTGGFSVEDAHAICTLDPTSIARGKLVYQPQIDACIESIQKNVGTIMYRGDFIEDARAVISTSSPVGIHYERHNILVIPRENTLSPRQDGGFHSASSLAWEFDDYVNASKFGATLYMTKDGRSSLVNVEVKHVLLPKYPRGRIAWEEK